MNSDGNVQLQADGTGKKVDTSELTRDDATVVERQRAVLADNSNVESGGLAEVRDRKLQTEDRNTALLESIDARLEELVILLKLTLS